MKLLAMLNLRNPNRQNQGVRAEADRLNSDEFSHVVRNFHEFSYDVRIG